MARFQINPGSDGSISLEMTGDDGVTTKAELNAQDTQGLVDLLGAVRQLTPGSVAEAPAEGVVQAVVDPAWAVPAVKAPQGRVLVVKHPGLGWMHFIFPEERAEQISKALAAELASAPAMKLN